MKNTLTICAILLLVFTSSCKNDDSENNNPINENNADLIFTQAIVINYGTSEQNGFEYEGYNLDLTLLSAGVNIDFITEQSSGNGDGLYFEMFSSEPDGYPSDSYTFKLTEPFPTGSFSFGELCIQCDFSGDGSDLEITEITGGTVFVEKSGDRYTISARIKDETGDTYTAFFEGSLTILDEADILNAKQSKVVFGYRKK